MVTGCGGLYYWVILGLLAVIDMLIRSHIYFGYKYFFKLCDDFALDLISLKGRYFYKLLQKNDLRENIFLLG